MTGKSPAIALIFCIGCSGGGSAGGRLEPARNPAKELRERRLHDDLPAPGEAAPDFELRALEPAEAAPGGEGGATIRLSSFRGKKPVVLIFGSYT